MGDSEFIEHADPGSPRANPPHYNGSSEFIEFADDNVGKVVDYRFSEYVGHDENGERKHDEHSDPRGYGEHGQPDEHSEHFEHSEHVEHDQTPGHNHEHRLDEHSEHAEQSRTPARPQMRRRSTIMLNEEELAHINHQEESHEEGPFSRAQEGDQVDLTHTVASKDKLIETVIEWKQGGQSVFVTGSFTGWKQMIPLRKFEDNVFVVVLKLAPGTHRMRFVVDGELRCSDDMNTATDSMGNLVNYMEVSADSQIDGDEQVEDDESQPIHEYTRQIPEIFSDPDTLDRFSSIEFTPPPQLPPHLDGVILNTNWTEKDNNSVLPIPNHVVLNHLATTSIKHNVLAVASVSRYRAKYITQILYSPINGV